MNFPDERDAFEAIVKEMFAALDKPLTKDKMKAFEHSFAHLNINEFARCRDKLLKNLQTGQEVPRSFGPANIWAIHHSLRAIAPPRPQQDRKDRFDEWEIHANESLLRYIRFKAGRQIHYGYTDDPARSAETTAPLVAYKNAFVTDVRDHIAEHGKPPDFPTRKKWWIECMRRAEEQIKEIRARYKEDLSCPV